MEELSAIFQRNAARREVAPRDAAAERVVAGVER
jgi:hypothetical protein